MTHLDATDLLPSSLLPSLSSVCIFRRTINGLNYPHFPPKLFPSMTRLRWEAQEVAPDVMVVPAARLLRPLVVPVEHRDESSHDAGRDRHVREVQEEEACAALDLHHVFLLS